MLLNMYSTSVSFELNYIKLHALIKCSVIAIQYEALSKSHVVELMTSLGLRRLKPGPEQARKQRNLTHNFQTRTFSIPLL